MRLTTARLVLSPVELADVDALWPFVTDAELTRHMTWAPHRDRAETVGFIESTLRAREEGSGYTFAIRRGAELCGLIGLDGVIRQMRAWRVDRAEIGYWLGPAFRGQGLVSEAAREVMRFAFEDLGLHKVTIGCISDNLASKKVIEGLGFRFLCEQIDHCHRHGRWWNHLFYELTEGEWRATRTASSPDPRAAGR